MINSPPLPLTKPHSLSPLALSLGITALAALALILANKLVGFTGRSAGLKDACWQLTTVRATLAAATVTTLICFRKDHLALLGLLYGLSLAFTHASTTVLHLPVGLIAAIVAGLAALSLRHLTLRHLRASRSEGTRPATPWSVFLELLPTLLPTLAFVALLATPSLLSKWTKLGAFQALATWTPDLALRVLAAAVTAGALTLLLPTPGKPQSAEKL